MSFGDRTPEITGAAIEPARLAQLDYLQLVVLDWETPAGTEDSGFPLLPAPKRACLDRSLPQGGVAGVGGKAGQGASLHGVLHAAGGLKPGSRESSQALTPPATKPEGRKAIHCRIGSATRSPSPLNKVDNAVEDYELLPRPTIPGKARFGQWGRRSSSGHVAARRKSRRGGQELGGETQQHVDTGLVVVRAAYGGICRGS